MKKIIAAALAFAMCLSLAACGTSGTATGDEAQAIVDAITQDAAGVIGDVIPEAVPDITDTTVPEAPEETEPVTEPETGVEPLPEGGQLCYVIDGGGITFNFYEYYSDDAKVYAGIEGVDSESGNAMWTFVTEPEYVGQLDNYTVVGPTVEGFIFVKEDVVYCLNFLDGSLEWTSDPLNSWPAGYYAIDDSCRFYFPGYFSPSLDIIGCDGKTVKSYEILTDIYGDPIDDFWCTGISMGKDGLLRINYEGAVPYTYVVDPETGCCEDMYPTSLSMTPEQIAGSWMDNYYAGEPNVILTVNEDLSYCMTTYDENGEIMHSYNGHVEIGTFIEDVGNDWLCFKLDSTDDPAFEDWSGIGDYVCSYYYQDTADSDYAAMSLTQVNNGDSVMSIYFDMVTLFLYRFPAMG